MESCLHCYRMRKKVIKSNDMTTFVVVFVDIYVCVVFANQFKSS